MTWSQEQLIYNSMCPAQEQTIPERVVHAKAALANAALWITDGLSGHPQDNYDALLVGAGRLDEAMSAIVALQAELRRDHLPDALVQQYKAATAAAEECEKERALKRAREADAAKLEPDHSSDGAKG